ncbi:N-acetylglucosamine-6-phosphate deacetylase [Alistipes sp.]|uniref:N-acetylglucosamine-6-phosphate deacetylase n=1 Tax=Alistipes sp. TaxID=1872444 RepID=UPI003AEF7EFB
MKKLLSLLTLLAGCLTAAAAGPGRVKIVDASVILPSRVVEHATILVEDGRIVAVGTDLAEPFEGAEVIDAAGRYAAPGFIDVHCHGGGGHDFSDGTVEAMLGAAEMHARHGTTLIYPTTASCSNATLFALFDTYRKAAGRNPRGAAFGGIHIEGGYLSPEMKGGQDPRYIKHPTPEDYNAILAAGGDLIARWTFAPELPGSEGLIRELSRRGIQLSMGHTSALYEEAVAAYDAGVSSITHFYSMTSGVTRRNALRYAGVIEAGYLLDGIYVETIGDGIHLPAPLLRLIWKVKGPDRIVGVTDAMRGAGMPDGPTVLGSIHDGMAAIIEDGVAKLPDRSSFAGSVCTTDRVVRNYIALAGASLPEAVQVMTLTPARLMRIDDRKGSIAAGKDADIVLFDKDINVSLTMIGGRVVYRK